MVSPVPQMDESASTAGDGTVGAEAADSKMPSKAQRARTEDIYTDKTFADLGLPANVVAALSACGYDRPSPVQQHAIPLGLLGSDLIVQAKSGTGKTVVFAVILLQRLKPEEKHVQGLVIAPTRELAIQTEQVVTRLSAALSDPPEAQCAAFVGGLPIVDDEKRLRRLVHIAVGTPGRLLSLIQNDTLKCDKIKMLVFDEADVLLGDGFYTDVTWLYEQLPKRKQIMAFSATYTKELLSDLEPLLKRPQRVMLCEETVSLKGVRQFYQVIGASPASSSPAGPGPAHQPPANNAASANGHGHSGAVSSGEETVAGQLDKGRLKELKVDALLQLLTGCSFHQAAVFCNDKPWADWLARRLCAGGFPAVYLGGDMAQTDRQRAMEAVRGFKARVIVSTDVLARGVDLDRINLVVDLDLPRDAATYVHRVGRTGRFGTHGVAVCMVTQDELAQLKGYLETVSGGDIEPLPEGSLPADLYTYELPTDWERTALETLKNAPKQQDSPPLPPSQKAATSGKTPPDAAHAASAPAAAAADAAAAGNSQGWNDWYGYGYGQGGDMGGYAGGGYGAWAHASNGWGAHAQGCPDPTIAHTHSHTDPHPQSSSSNSYWHPYQYPHHYPYQYSHQYQGGGAAGLAGLGGTSEAADAARQYSAGAGGSQGHSQGTGSAGNGGAGLHPAQNGGVPWWAPPALQQAAAGWTQRPEQHQAVAGQGDSVCQSQGQSEQQGAAQSSNGSLPGTQRPLHSGQAAVGGAAGDGGGSDDGDIVTDDAELDDHASRLLAGLTVAPAAFATPRTTAQEGPSATAQPEPSAGLGPSSSHAMPGGTARQGVSAPGQGMAGSGPGPQGPHQQAGWYAGQWGGPGPWAGHMGASYGPAALGGWGNSCQGGHAVGFTSGLCARCLQAQYWRHYEVWALWLECWQREYMAWRERRVA